jgi:D-glycero-alpha-D-manno-heptose-7-phosphate kinase
LIIVRSPLRITLGGGGTDLPSYYRRFGGYLISAAIDKYVYVSIMRSFQPGIALKYSDQETVGNPADIKHPIFRETLKLYAGENLQLEITTLADIPSGTGLGSSSSFATALIAAIFAHKRMPISKEDLARKSCEIEIDKLGDPIGKQDQYISAYGGVTQFQFNPDETVNMEPLNISRETLWELEDNLLLFFTGFSRSASAILKDQDDETKESNAAMLGALHFTKELGVESSRALMGGDLQRFGELLHDHWIHKRSRSQGMTSGKIDELYELGKANGAIGGKLVGAGGGGFLMFYAEDRAKLRSAMSKAGLEEVRFRFDFEGTKVILT